MAQNSGEVEFAPSFLLLKEFQARYLMRLYENCLHE